MKRNRISTVPDDTVAYYSPRQKRLLKERFYRWAINTSTGTRVEWRRVASELKKITGIEIDDESLRQNFAPVSARSGKRPRDFYDPARYAALHHFLINPQINYLHEFEFSTESPPSAALAIALEVFLNGDAEPSENSVLNPLRGRFEGSIPGANDDIDIVFDIDFSTPERLTEVTAHFGHDLVSEGMNSDVLSFAGWAAANSDGFVMFLLKNTYEEDIRCYLLTQTAPMLHETDACEAITLMQYAGVQREAMVQRKVFVAEDEEARIVYEALDLGAFFFILTRT